MSDRGINHVTVKLGANKTEDFVNFIESLVDELKEQFDGYFDDLVLISDGATTHSTLRVRDTLVEHGIRMLIQSPHSPGKINQYHANIL